MGKVIYSANILNPKENGTIEFLQNGYLVINSNNGKIIDVGKNFPTETKKNSSRLENFQDYFLLPGLIDLHSHIPQLPNSAKNADELIPWLKNYIFPLETKFSINDYVRFVSDFFFREALSFGTTCIVCFSSVHKEATDIAFQTASVIGIRAFIGKAMMDKDMSKYPEPLPKWKENINDSLELAKKWHNSNGGKLQYIFSPRFAASCSLKLLERTAEIARSDGFFIQSHLAENRSEINYIKSLFPNFSTNTHIYKKTGLLGEKTLLAHCLHLSQVELQILSDTQTKIVHCPTSNIFLQSGFLPFRRYKSHDIEIGLGTDVAGGYSLSLWNEMKNAIETSKIVRYINPNNAKPILTSSECFWISTLGAAKILQLDNIIGNFEKEKDADFILIKPKKEFYFYCKSFEVEHILSTLIYLPHTYEIEKVFIQGKEMNLQKSVTINESIESPLGK